MLHRAITEGLWLNSLVESEGQDHLSYMNSSTVLQVLYSLAFGLSFFGQGALKV